MKRLYVVLAISVFLVIALSIRTVDEKNPNFNYISLNISPQVKDCGNNSSLVSLTLDATGFSYNFSMYSIPASAGAGQTGVAGFDIYYLNTSNYSQATNLSRYYLGMPCFGNLVPTFETSMIMISGYSPVQDITFFTGEMPQGYYMFQLGNYTLSGTHRNFMDVYYSTIIFLNSG